MEEFVHMYAPELSCGGCTGQREYNFTVLVHIDGEEEDMKLSFILN
jgi:hypothetical protein